MDEEGMKMWIRRVWCSRPGGLLKKQSLLTLDSFSAHLVSAVHCRLQKEHTDTCVIPGGLTSQFWPLYVSINKPFKQQENEVDRMANGLNWTHIHSFWIS